VQKDAQSNKLEREGQEVFPELCALCPELLPPARTFP